MEQLIERIAIEQTLTDLEWLLLLDILPADTDAGVTSTITNTAIKYGMSYGYVANTYSRAFTKALRVLQS